jgi:hypothetical protein
VDPRLGGFNGMGEGPHVSQNNSGRRNCIEDMRLNKTKHSKGEKKEKRNKKKKNRRIIKNTFRVLSSTNMELGQVFYLVLALHPFSSVFKVKI